ncbi:MAG: ribosomal protein S19 family protein [Nanoarchaeota archaeon]|nr:ribosomal protein S19 family protein [Nanoarchaeota archaeon]
MVEEVRVRSKEKKYRGQSLDFLKGLDVRESAKYLTARSRRSVLRNFDVIEKFIKLCEKKIERKKKIRTHLRDIVIVPKFVGMTIGVHNGKSFQDVDITLEMIGHRLGEFALTRSKVTHSSAGVGATKGSRAKKK